MEVRTRSVKGRRFWRASGGHLAIVTVAFQLPFFGNGFRSKSRGNIRSGVPKAGSLSYSASFWQLLRRRWCQTVMALLFLWIHHRRGGGHAAWTTACPPHNIAQAYIHSITYTYFHTWRGHSSLAICVDSTWGATDTGYKPSLDWRRARRQGLLPMVGEILGSHWTAIARLKLGSPQPVRCCPATVCHPHWVHGDKGPPEKQTGTMAPGNHKRNYQKRPVFKLGCWNVRTMMTGLSASLQDIKDSRKTAVTNDELKRLNMDIATLQETRLADSGTLKEKDYTFFWQGKRSNEPR